MLDLLRDGPLATGEFVSALELNRYVVVQHLAVLRNANLVLVERQGRRKLNYLNAAPIQAIHDRWVSQFTQPWIAALVGLKGTVEQSHLDDSEHAKREDKAIG